MIGENAACDVYVKTALTYHSKIKLLMSQPRSVTQHLPETAVESLIAENTLYATEKHLLTTDERLDTADKCLVIEEEILSPSVEPIFSAENTMTSEENPSNDKHHEQTSEENTSNDKQHEQTSEENEEIVTQEVREGFKIISKRLKILLHTSLCL